MNYKPLSITANYIQLQYFSLQQLAQCMREGQVWGKKSLPPSSTPLVVSTDSPSQEEEKKIQSTMWLLNAPSGQQGIHHPEKKCEITFFQPVILS